MFYDRYAARHGDSVAREEAQIAEDARWIADAAAKKAELDGYTLEWEQGHTLIDADGVQTDRYLSNGQFDSRPVGAGADGGAFNPFTGGGSDIASTGDPADPTAGLL